MVEIPKQNSSIGKYAVNRALWERVTDSNPSHFEGSGLPVERVSWMDCVRFCNQLSQLEGLQQAYTISGEEATCVVARNGYRLPTEWEWCFAAQAGQGFHYAGSDNIDEVAWYYENSSGGMRERKSLAVGEKKSNAFGLYDMSGNVFEWCWDWYGREAPVEGSMGPSTGTYKMNLGGSWNTLARYANVSHQHRSYPAIRSATVGFRLCRTIR